MPVIIIINGKKPRHFLNYHEINKPNERNANAQQFIRVMSVNVGKK